MYEVTASLKTILTTADLDKAMATAEEAFKTNNYVRVSIIDYNENRWYSRSVKIFHR